MSSIPAMIRRILVPTIAILITAGPAWGQSETGTTLAQFMLIEPSARIAGMGNAGVSLYEGLDAAYYNPAAIGRVNQMSLEFSHSEWLADISYDYAAFALPFGGYGTPYISVTALNSGEMDVRTVDHPLGTGERFSVTDVGIALGYGRQITQRFAVGGQVTWVQETIWHTSTSTAMFNLGTLYRISATGLHVGSSLSNFGTHGQYGGRDLRVTYDADPARNGDNGTLPSEQFTGDFPVPALFRVGVGYPVRLNEQTRLQLALDAFHPSDNTESASLGAELDYRRALAVRLGYQNAFQKDSEVGLTLGAGWRGELANYGYRLDYAWADHGRLGNTQRITLGFNF